MKATKQAITRDQLMQVLKQKFPNMWMKPAEDFGDGFDETAIWTGEGSTLHDEKYDMDVNIFSLYSESKMYDMGVHNNLVSVLDEYGYYAEFYDGGTVFISQS